MTLKAGMILLGIVTIIFMIILREEVKREKSLKEKLKYCARISITYWISLIAGIILIGLGITDLINLLMRR